MTKSIHHPEDELLASYSAGSLFLSEALCISAHVEQCTTCLQKVQAMNQLGSELMQQLKPTTVSDQLKSKLLNSLDDLVEEESAKSTRVDPTIPRSLHQFIETDYQNLKWKRVSFDIQSCELTRDSNGAKVELLKIRPGGSASTHTHIGNEFTVILEGSFSDEEGLYRQGDFIHRDSRHSHTPVASLDRECICLAVTEGPVQFSGLFGRFINPILRRSYD